MNVTEINPGTAETLAVYVESTIILTLITAWAMIALHDHSSFHPGGNHMIHRVAWPVFYGYELLHRMLGAARHRVNVARDRLMHRA